MQIFLDETGQLSKSTDGEYFIIGTFTVGDPRRTQKRFVSWRQFKFPKKLKNLSEIKFSNSGIDDDLRLKTLKEITRLDVRIRYGFIRRKNIPLDFRSKGRVRTGHLYTEIVSNILESYLPITDKDFRIFCDNRNLKSLKKSEFKSIISTKLISRLAPNPIIQIEMLDSTTSPNIQIADWICGALGRYYNKKKLGQECFDILKNNLLDEGIELFKDYWSKNQKTQSED
ncbi:MAG: hypothetical protein UU16_C0046G0017 [Candidatus Woesebacteria bacterium GW2011_GWA2_40_7]|uniref:DUF3800 domain-containing protein n=3 Tax=Candidatus Woeseibacteriota TaxID=1752722 RepID=A0A0G0XW78_9BACT|nr:MAG: hypothetical protein UT17_C0006G0015 [Candidatus Woesebacteria bacterium GW2011_GWB1_39_10]KKR72103.1 MAG: hypothetical protein UU16_C0046G0017 [Candidatus Woesebacteria bacterium GW2011_GWA2_40_7]KKR92147.1 MAG: hypothetical protein UU42_C0003G0016 [Candidatus Woesebacteria bacterium GW2011_GWA1_41_13b]